MEKKKSEKACLENKGSIFLLTVLVIKNTS